MPIDLLEQRTTTRNPKGLSPFIKEILSHSPYLMSLARRLCKNNFCAENLFQETYLRALKNQDKFRPNSNSIAWLSTIMKNLYINGYNSEKIKPIHQDISPLEVIIGKEDSKDFQLIHLTKQNIPEVTKEDFSDRVYLILMSLPEDYRNALISCCAHGKSYKDAALLLNTKIGTVKSRINRGKGLFKRKYNSKKELQES